MSWIREHYPDLPTWFADVRQRPAVHLGQKSIAALEHQLMGIDFAEDFYQIPAADRIGGFDRPAFEQWVDDTLNTSD
jgi:hypothetical protein